MNPCLTQLRKKINLHTALHSLFSWCITLFQARLFPFATLQNLSYYTALCTHNSLAIFIQNIKLYMFIVENREIQKSIMKKITLMKKINIIHNSTSGSIFVVFSLKYIHIYTYICVCIYVLYIGTICIVSGD